MTEGVPAGARGSGRGPKTEWSVHAEGERTLLTSRAEVVLKGGVLGGLLESLARYRLSRMAPRTLAAFKYLVEHGEPPLGKHARHRRTCLPVWRQRGPEDTFF